MGTMMNFNKLATKSDGACVSWVLGCMDRKAHNFNKKAEKDNGSCKFHVMGCMNAKATNFMALATKDNGSCTMPKLIVKPVVAKCWLSALAGCFHPKTSSTRTKEVASTCVLTEIDSCNSPITHSDNWCWMKMSFSNCKSIEFSSGKCKTPTTRGKCNKSRINGNIIRIDLHSDWWKQPAKTEQVCQSQNIAAKSVVWAADMLGVKCDGSTTAASALVSGAAILLSYSMLF